MFRLLLVFAVLAATLCACSNNSRSGNAVHASTAQERQAAFAWFDKLEIPDVKGLPFVRVATGRWEKNNDGVPETIYEYGFLLEDKDGKFRVFTCAARSQSYTRSVGPVAPYAWVTHMPADFPAWAKQ